MPIGFRFGWIPFIASVAMVALGVSLGQWQMRRAAEKQGKETMLALREAAPPVRLGGKLTALDQIEYHRVLASGEFVRDWPVYLDNRPYQGKAGFYVLMPFKIAGSDLHVMVARGWVARDMSEREKLPAYPTPEGTVEIAGVAKRGLARLMELGHAQTPVGRQAILQNIDIAEFASASKFAMQPFLIEQSKPNDGVSDQLVRDWPRPASGMEKNLGYAFQWYGLSIMAGLFFVISGIRRGTIPNKSNKSNN